MLAIDKIRQDPLQSHDLPMFRHFCEPVHVSGPVLQVSLARSHVNPPRDRLVDDSALLLLQQRDQLLLGADVAPDAPVGVVEEADDGGLFGERWEWRWDRSNVFEIQCRTSQSIPD